MSDQPDGGWRLIILPRAEKDLKRLKSADQRRVRVALEALGQGPYQGDIRKLQGADNTWRMRVGELRIRFLIADDRTVVVTRILPRGRAYRD